VSGRSISDVPVYLNNNRYGMDMSSEMGEYIFEDLIRGEQYSVRPVKRDDIHDGLNILDMIVLLKHLTGMDVIDNPYQLFAADVDRNDVVNILDLYYLRNVLIGLENKFPSNLSWDFIASLDADHQYTIDELVDMSSVLKIDTFRSAQREQVFTGIKLGDLDFNGNNSGVNIRSVLSVLELNVQESASDQVEIILPDNIQLEGLQFSLLINENTAIDIVNNAEEYAGWRMYRAENNTINFQYVNLTGSRNENLQLNIKGGLDAFAKAVMLDNKEQQALAQDNSGNKYSIDIRSVGVAHLGARIYPNPADEVLMLYVDGQFEDDQEIGIIIYDQIGRLVLSQTAFNNKDGIIIEIENLASGQYSIATKLNKKLIKTQKFIKL